jgi:hypothetical protein
MISNQTPAPTARRTTMVQVAGTAGGVGTTTVAALIFAALSQDVLGAPQLYDHAAGELGLRLPEGDEVRLVNPSLGLHDCGARAAAAVERLADPETVLVVVTAATAGGCAAADRVLDEIVARHGAGQFAAGAGCGSRSLWSAPDWLAIAGARRPGRHP